MRGDLPSGSVTFLFTDIEGSTKLLHELGPDEYATALATHRRLLREVFASHGGVEVDTQGDAFFVAFSDAKRAVAAASTAQEALSGGPIAVRMGLHTGQPVVTDEGYVGDDVHRGARIAAAAHGGQVVVSKETREFLGDGWSFTDLGEHRVKDFDQPVWIFQLGDDRFPPLKTISNTNLPRPASSFVGREREVQEVASLLGDGSRLVTLTGPGGTGKTRLAIESASEVLSAYRNGVFWVPLARIREPALVPTTVGQTIGAKDGLAEHIGEREMLLVLDNFEQVVDAAAELSSLLSACPNLRLLVTSRELLRVQGEVEYAVPPLASPEAVKLFCTRSHLEPEDTIAQLCERLDNLPLAIELAAARTKVLSPAQILERLSQRLDLLKGGRDTEARQRTLRATIEWSHDLLDEEEKRLFARLSVFRGGCSLESAEQVADAPLDALESLVEKSLVRRAGDRFWMLETIREFAAERLEESRNAEDIRRRYAEHFMALAEEAEPHLRHDSAEWADRVEQEHDNLRATLDWLDAAGDSGMALHLCGTLVRFWYLKSHLTEGKQRLEASIAEALGPTPDRAKALMGLSVMELNLGNLEKAKAYAEQALTLSQELGDTWGVAYSQMMIGNALAESRELARAVPMFEEAIRLFRALDDEHYALIATGNLAWVVEELGDKKRGRALRQEVVLAAREHGNQRMEASMLSELGMTAYDADRLEEAAVMLRQAIEINHRTGDTRSLALDLGRLAAVLAKKDKPDAAARILSKSVGIFDGLNATRPWWASDRDEKTLDILKNQLTEETLGRIWDEGRRLSVDEAVELALSDA